MTRPSPFARGLISTAGIYLIAAGVALGLRQPGLNGASLIGAPLLMGAGVLLLLVVAELNERGGS